MAPTLSFSFSPWSLVSWRTAAIVFALLNLKSLPLAWHFRIFYRMLGGWYSEARIKGILAASAARAKSNPDATQHPLFEPVSIFSRAPLLETDYNMHKSNSTYFIDLDESRTALMTRVLLPGSKAGAKSLEREGHMGRLAVILGSVHTSFHREILPYERYEVRSRLLAWDRKWIIVGSWFVRPARPGSGKEEVLLASALSKYVVKKGRFTVSPERCFIGSGWLPPNPNKDDQINSSTSSPSSSSSPAPAQTSDTPGTVQAQEDGLPAAVPEAAAVVDAAVNEVVEKLEGSTATDTDTDSAGWEWHRIEAERVRGLAVVDNWLALDKELLDEFLRGSLL